MLVWPDVTYGRKINWKLTYLWSYRQLRVCWIFIDFSNFIREQSCNVAGVLDMRGMIDIFGAGPAAAHYDHYPPPITHQSPVWPPHYRGLFQPQQRRLYFVAELYGLVQFAIKTLCYSTGPVPYDLCVRNPITCLLTVDYCPFSIVSSV